MVKNTTLDKYYSYFNRFCEWAELKQVSRTNGFDFDAAAALYIEALWADGFGRAEGSYLLATLLKHQLNLSWRFIKTWSKNKLPTRVL